MVAQKRPSDTQTLDQRIAPGSHNRKLNFTKKALENLPPPRAGRAYYYDTQVRGLALAVAGTGRKTFLLYRKIQGRPERVRLGPFPDLSIEQARGRASELNAAIARGENPAQAHRVVRSDMTLGELFEQYLERHAKVHNRKSWHEQAALFRRYLDGWRNRKITHIQRMDVVNLHAQIAREHGPYAANRAVALLRGMFNRARYDWEWKGDNPAEKIKKFPERARKRFLQPDEVPAFFKALAEEPNEMIRDFVLISLFTGARQANVRSMRWEDVNLERGVWSIPETKTGEPLDVVLSPEAVDILRARRENSTAEWVFPGTGKTRHLVGPRKPWGRILRRAGLKNLRLHDLRRTLGSWQAALGSSLVLIGRSLGHQNPQTTQIYARLNLDPVRQSVNTATRAILVAGGLGKAGPTGETTPLLPEPREGSKNAD